jgi:hypothetical protein
VPHSTFETGRADDIFHGHTIGRTTRRHQIAHQPLWQRPLPQTGGFQTLSRRSNVIGSRSLMGLHASCERAEVETMQLILLLRWMTYRLGHEAFVDSDGASYTEDCTIVIPSSVLCCSAWFNRSLLIINFYVHTSELNASDKDSVNGGNCVFSTLHT